MTCALRELLAEVDPAEHPRFVVLPGCLGEAVERATHRDVTALAVVEAGLVLDVDSGSGAFERTVLLWSPSTQPTNSRLTILPFAG